MVVTRAGDRSVAHRQTTKKRVKECLNTKQRQGSEAPQRSRSRSSTASENENRGPSGNTGRDKGGSAAEKHVESALGVVGTHKPKTRAHTRSGSTAARRRKSGVAGVTIGISSSDSDAEGWTETQAQALQKACSTIKSSSRFWQLVADQVHGKDAEDCFKKFYSERTVTRSAKRLRPEINEMANRASTESLRNADFKSTAHTLASDTAKGTAEQNKATRTRDNPATSTRRTRAASRGNPEVEVTDRTELLLGEQKRLSRPASTSIAAHGKAKLGRRRRAAITAGTESLHSPQQENVEFCERPLPDDHGGASSGWEGDKEVESASDLEKSVDSGIWTEEQESALRNAYATIRPSGHFWHDISKQVSGKNASECFNKFYSAHPTPPRAGARLRVKAFDSVQSPSSTPKARTRTRGKQRILQAHRAVRRILRKQQADDQDYEADAFAALERPEVVRSVVEMADDQEISLTFGAVERPEARGRESNENVDSDNGLERRNLSGKENLEPATLSSKMPVFSASHFQGSVPEVLKKVTDPGMLDKYIDHFHNRHTTGKRAASQGRGSKKTRHNVHNLDSLVNRQQEQQFGKTTADVIQRAKEELRNVFSKSGGQVGNVIEITRSDDFEEDLEDSEGSQMSF